MKDINVDMRILNEILESREERATKQRWLLSKYPYTLVSFTINTPGAIKSSILYSKIHKEGMDTLLGVLKNLNTNVAHIETIDKSTGQEGFISLDLNPFRTKEITVELEDTHHLGRIFDFDVFDVSHNQITRADLQLEPRKCLLCDENAIKCMRQKNHTYEELSSKVEEIGISFFNKVSKKSNVLKSKISMSKKVYIKLKSDILENRLKPGEKLIEENLAEELRVSRTPVREALKQLDQDGLVTYYPRKGSVVSQISIKDAQELYEVREALEGLAIKNICLNMDSQDVKILENIVSNMDEAINKDDYETMKILHKKWTEATLLLTKNDLLKDYLVAVTENLGRLRKISLYEPEQTLEAYRETKEILHAIVNRDADTSEVLARIHVKNARKRFEKNLINKQN